MIFIYTKTVFCYFPGVVIMLKNPGSCRGTWEGSPAVAIAKQGFGLLLLCVQVAVFTQTHRLLSSLEGRKIIHNSNLIVFQE